MSSVGAIILAAGRASRFRAGPNDSKVLAKFADRPLVRHVAEAALKSQARPVVVVVGHAGDKVEAALDGLDFVIVRNPDPDAGLSRSLAMGLEILPSDLEGAVILLADMPFVTTVVIDRLIMAFLAATERPQAVVPVHDGQRGNPVLLARSIFAAAKQLTGDRGARALLEASEARVLECPIDDDAIAIDVDTQDTLARLKAGDRSG